MKFLTKQEFQLLSEPEKSDYYELLLDERNTAVTVSQLEDLALEFAKINYKDSSEVSKMLLLEAEAISKADERYAREKAKKGLLVGFLIVCGAALVALAVAIIGMF